MVTKEVLIDDLQKVAAKTVDGTITRNFYRANGTFPESVWQEFFPKFEDFLRAAGLDPESIQPETSEVTEDTWTISLPKTRIKTLDELVAYCEIDLSVWEVERFIANKWEVFSNEAGNQPLFQIKAFLRRRKDIEAVRQEIEQLKELAKQAAKPKKFIPTQPTGNMLEINMPDPHFGKLAWAEETGYENYNTPIAAKVYNRAFEALLERTAGYKFDQIIYVVGNDLLNSDDTESRTTKGTVVTTDTRYHKTFKTVRTTIIRTIEVLRNIAPVKVIMVPGNHDTLSTWHLGDSLECYFHNDPMIEIDNSPRYRKYHRYGNVMLMFTHGDKGKKNDYPLLMATEQPMMFGETKFREAHTGHTHQTKLEEQHGVRVRVLPALCPPDDWHAENAYVGNLRNAEAYIWNKNEGLIGMAFYCDNTVEDIEA